MHIFKVADKLSLHTDSDRTICRVRNGLNFFSIQLEIHQENSTLMEHYEYATQETHIQLV